jgi:hypothetical protein
MVSHLQNDDFSVKLENANESLTYIEKVSVRFVDSSVDIFQINLKRDSIISRSQIKVGKVVFQASRESDENSNDVVDFDLSNLISYVKKIRLFVESLNVSEIKVLNASGEYVYKNLNYKSDEDHDHIFMKMDQSGFDITADWSKSGSIDGSFQNIMGFSGSCRMDFLKNSELKYQITIGNSDYKLKAQGAFVDEAKNIFISEALLTRGDKQFKFGGKIFVSEQRLNLSTTLSLDNFVDVSNIPSEITKNFQNISANISINKTEKEINSQIDFEKEGRKLGNSAINLKGNNLSIKSDVSWIDFWGYKLKSFDLQSSDLKNFTANVLGENFKISSEIIRDKKINIQNLICDLDKNRIVLEKPFALDDQNVDSSFHFDFKSFSFFKNFCKLEGTASGRLSIKNGSYNIDANVHKIIHEDYELYMGKVFGNSGNLQINVASAKCFGNLLKDVIFTKKNNKLSLKSRLNNNSNIVIDGNISDNLLGISGTIKNQDNLLRLNSANLNFKDKLYKIPLEITKGKNFGKFSLSVSPHKIEVLARDFSLSGLGQIFDQNIPQCVVNGSFNLVLQQDLFCGTGSFNLEKLLARENTLNISLNQNQKGLSLQGRLTNATDDLKLDILIPFFIDRNLNCSIKNNGPLSILSKGNAHVENLFELPDGVILKGEINSDFNIEGSIVHPKIQGKLEYSKASIIVSDVVLKNGTIKLIGKEDKFFVDSASFTDAFGKKAKINGSATFFFSDKKPNINANLQLDFDNFRLFDTDSMRINVTGQGKMTGPLDDMKLSGNLKVPLCELTFLGGSDNNSYKDITIVNDLFLSEKEKQENDFFSYDIDLESSEINVIGDIYKLKFGGRLHLGSYQGKATLSGGIDLKEGKLNLFGKRMVFKKSRIEFLENYPFDPKMRLICSRNVNQIKVNLEVKNDPGKGISLNLYSKPVFTQDVILAQMMFGKSSKDISVAEAAQLAHAVNSLKQNGYIFSILNTFQNIGLVDSLSITSENNSSSLYKNSQTSSDNKLNIKAGKYISDDVYIGVNKKDEETSFEIDLSIGSHTSLKVNSQGEVGVSWKFRY